jgi:hypothetical protein
VLVWHLLTKDEDYRNARPELVRAKHRALVRLAGQETSRTRPSQWGATGSSHDRGRAPQRGGTGPPTLALRPATDRVRPDDASPPGA